MATTRRVDYDKIKREAASRRRSISQAGRDIGSIPPVANARLRRECDRHFQAFCENLFPRRFDKPWSPDHIRVINQFQDTVEYGGRIAVAMPRGNGKTSLAECAALWGDMTARLRFTVIVASTAGDATDILEHLQVELGTNEDLAAIYPEICYPIWSLDGEARRAKGQLHHGTRTGIVWGGEEIRFAMIPGVKASGAVIQTAGIEGRIRGRRVALPGGETIRPDFAIIDDPQDEESAYSETQCAKRRRIIERAVGGLAGPGRSIAMTALCTVMRRGDLADQLLDHEQSPDWRGIRTKLMGSMPANDELWEQYAELRKKSLIEREDITLATMFYRANRAAMDKGAVASWPERYESDRGEISAIQHAMNIKIKDEHTFWAEYQNEPPDDDAGDELELTPKDIMMRVNGLNRREIIAEAEYLTAMIDVQGKLLYYSVYAWSGRFDGWCIDYGTFPDQKGRKYFTLRDAKRTLGRWKPGAGQEAQLYAGLMELTGELCGREWMSEGTPTPLDLCLIDANWSPSTPIVEKVCRASPYSAQLMPSRGRYYGASTQPIADRKKKRGDRVGLNWYIPAKVGRVREVVWDTNWWKSFFMSRLATPVGDPGSLTLFGKNPEGHKMLAEHLTAERRFETEGRGRRVHEWKIKKPNLDNHLLDTSVGCALAASIRGAALGEQHQGANGRTRKRVRLSEIARTRG